MITVDVEIDTAQKLPVTDRDIRLCCRRVFSDMNVSDGHVTIVVSSDEFLRKLKKRFFNLDVYTDVIAFNLENGAEPADGEIYISSDRSKENARSFNVPWPEEMLRLVIHGSLHLLGYDDQTSEEKDNMTILENKYLSAIFDQKLN